MANDAAWDMRVVSRSKEAIERLFRILNYEDDEFFMYRVFEAEHSESDSEWIDEEDGFFVADLWGSVAWGMDAWFDDDESRHKLYEDGWCPGHPNARYVTLLELCPLLDIGVDAYCTEPCNDIRQHYVVDHDGGLVVADDPADWEPVSEYERNGEWLPLGRIYG